MPTPVISYTRGSLRETKALSRVLIAAARRSLQGSKLRRAGLVFTLAVVALSGILTAVLPQPARAATSDYLNFQARLEEADGAIVPDGYYNVEFKLYNVPTNGTALWTETRLNSNSQGVQVINGYLTVNLGSVTAFPNTISWDQPLYISMNVGGVGATATWDGEMSPRLQLTAVPYAFQANSAKQLQSTDASGNTSTLKFDTTTASRNILLPDLDGTVCLEGSSTCNFAAASGSNNYINNGTSLQANANFHIASVGVAQPTAQLQAITSQTADLLTFEDASGIAMSGINNLGQLYYQAGSYKGILVQDDLTANGSNVSYHLPYPGGSGNTDVNICLSTGNCAGAGAGVTAPNGSTQNHLAKFTNTSNGIGDSLLTDDGTYIGLNATVNEGLISVVSTSATEPGLFVQSAASATVPAVVVRGGATPGTGGDLIQFQDSNSVALGGINSLGQLYMVNGSTGTIKQDALAQTTEYHLTDPGSATVDICLSSGNCAGAGGGVTATSSSLNFVTKFDQLNSNEIGASSIYDDGSFVGIHTTTNSGLLSLVGIPTATTQPTLYVQGTDSSTVPLSVFKGGATPTSTADIIQAQLANGTAVAGIDYQGNIYGKKITANTGLEVVAGGATIDAGDFTVSAGNTSLTGNLSVSGTSNLAGNTTVGGSFTVSTGATSLGGGLTVNGASLFNGNISQSGANTFATGSGPVSLNGNTSVTGTKTFSVNGGLTTLGAGLQVTSGTSTFGGAVSISGTNNLTVNSGAVSFGGTLNVSGATSIGSNTSIGGSLGIVGNFSQTGAGSTFSTGTGAVSLNGSTTISGTNNLEVQGGTVTLGLAGVRAGSLQFANGSTTDLSVLQFGTPLNPGSGNATYLVPGINSGSSDEICLKTTANCAGAGTSVTSDLGGRTNFVTKFNDTRKITESSIYDDGTYVGINNDNASGAANKTGLLSILGMSTATTQSSLFVQGGANATAPVAILRSGTGSTADFLQLQDSNNNSIFKIGANGSVNIATSAGTTVFNVNAAAGGAISNSGTAQFGGGVSNTSFGFNSVNATNPVLVVQGATSQAGDLFQARNSAGTPLAYIDKDGNFFAKNGSFGGTLNVTGATTLSGNTTVNNGGSFTVTSGPTTLSGSLTVNNSSTFNGNVSISGAYGLTVNSGATQLGGTLGVTQLASFSGGINVTNGATIAGGLTANGAVNLNTTGSGTTTIGNSTSAFSLSSTGLNVTSGGALSGITTISMSGAISAATSGNTINGLVINGGALSGITGYTQTSGNFDMSGSTGTFATGSGAVNLNGNTTIASGKTLTVTSGATSLGGSLTVTGLSTLNGGATILGNTQINTTGTGSTAIGNTGAAFSLSSTGLNVTSAGVLSGITGYSQTSGNFAITGAGSFSTGTGPISLNGSTSISGATSIGNTLNVSGVTNFGSNVSINGGSNLTVSGATSVGGALTVTGLTTLKSNALVQGGSLTLGTTTAPGSLNIYSGSAAATLQVDGALAAGATYYLPSASPGTLCTDANNCNFQPQGNYETTNGTDFIRNQTTLQTPGNFNIVSAAGAVAAKIQGASGQDIIEFFTSGGSTPIAKIDSLGNFTAVNGTFTGSLFASGNLSIGGSTTLNGNTTIGNAGTLSVAGLSTFNGGVSVANGNFTQTGAASTFSTGGGAVSLNGNTTVATGQNFTVSSGATSLGGTLTVNSTTNLKANTTIGGSLAVQGAAGITVGLTDGTTPGVITFGTTSSTGSTVLQASAPSGTGNVTLNLPSLPGSSTDTLCVKNANNCNFESKDGNDFIQNNPLTQQSASSFNIAAASSVVAAKIQGGSGADIIDFFTSANGTTPIAKIDSLGNLTAVGGTFGGNVSVAGNFSQSGTTTTFSTGGGAVSLNGNTNVASGKNFTVVNGATTLGGTLNVSGVTTLSNLSAGGIVQADTSGVLSAGSINLGTSTYVTGVLPVGNGGTGLSSVSSNGILLGNGTGNLNVLSPVANRVLGTSATGVPSYLDTLPATVQGNITSVNNVGGLTSGKISSGFGAISTTNDIGTTANLQGGALTVGSGFSVSGTGVVTYANGTSDSGSLVCRNTSGQLANCNVSYALTTDTTNFIRNQTTAQTSANFNIVSRTGEVAAKIQGAATQNIINFYTSGNSTTPIAYLDASGNFFAANGTFSGAVSAGNGLSVTGATTLGGNTTINNSGTLSVAGLSTFNGGVSLGNNSSFTQTGSGTFSTGTGGVSLNGPTTITGTNTLSVVGGLTTLSAGLTANGPINLNTAAGAGNTAIGNSTGSFTLTSSTLSINAGALSGVTGYAQTSGNFDMSASTTGTFSTGGGNVSLNGNTTIATGKNLTVASGATSLGGTLTVNNTATFNANASIQGGQLTLGKTGTPGSLVFYDPTSGFTSTITVGGTNTSAQTFTLPADKGGQICTTANNCNYQSSGTYETVDGTDFIRNRTTLQTDGNFNIVSRTGEVAAKIQGASGQDIIEFFTSGGSTPIAKIDSLGNFTAVNGTFNGSLSATGAASFGGNTTVGGTSTLSVGGATTLSSTLSVGSTSTFTGAATFNGGVTVANSNFTQTGATSTFSTGGGAVNLNGATTVSGANTFTVNGGLTTLKAGLTATGATSINTTGTANTAIGNATGTLNLTDSTFSLTSGSGLNVTSLGALSGITTINMSGAITAATSGNTINGLVINAGSLSSVTGYSQTGGNFAITGTGTFSTGSGDISLNGNTTVATGKTLTVTDGATSLGGTLTVSGASNFNGNVTIGATNTLKVGSTVTLSSLSAGGIVRAAPTTGVLSVGSIDLASTDVSGILPVQNGGTGASTLMANGILIGNGQNPVTALAPVTNSILATDATTGAPSLVQTLPSVVQGNITQVDNNIGLTQGKIGSGFGTITTGSTISTTANLQGGTLKAGTAQQFQVSGGGVVTYVNSTTKDTSAVVCQNSLGQLAGCIDSFETTGGNDFIRNKPTSQQTGSYFNIGAPASTVAAKIQGGTGADIIDFYTSGNNTTPVAYIDASGNFSAFGGTFSSLLNANGGLSVTGTTSLNGNTTITTGNTLTVGGATTLSGTLSVGSTSTFTGLATLNGGLSVVGTTNINTTGTANTNIGNATGTLALTDSSFSLTSGSGLNVSSVGALSGITSINMSGTISAATTGNTINGLIINGGALSGVTGYNQQSGDFLQQGTGTFTTGSGAVSLKGDTTVTTGKNFTVFDGATSLGGTLSVAGLSTFNGNVSVSNTNTLYVGGATTLNGTLSVGGTSTFAGASTFNSTANIQGGLTLGKSGVGGTDGSLNVNFAGTTDQALFTFTAPNTAGNTSYVFPGIDGGTTAQICLSTGNCAGAGNSITGSGTQNYVARFTNTNQLGTGLIYDDASYVGINSPAVKNGTLSVVGNSTSLPSVYVEGVGSGSKASLQVKQGSGQTGGFADFTSNAGGTVATISNNGSFRGTSATLGNGTASLGTGAQLEVVTSGSVAGQIIRASGTSTGPAFQIQNSTGLAGASFNATGNQLKLGSFTTTGTTFYQGLLTLSDGTSSGKGLTIETKTGAFTADQTVQIPQSSVATDELCLKTLGNCAGSGGGVTSPVGGTQNYVTKFTNNGGTQIGDSSIFDNGAYVGINDGGKVNDLGLLSIVGASSSQSSLFLTGSVSATTPVAIIRGGATPGVGGDLLQLQNNGGTVLAKIDANGNLTAQGGSFNGALSATGNLSIGGSSSLVGSVTIGNNSSLTQTGTGTFSTGTGGVSLNGATTVSSTANIQGLLTLGTASANGQIAFNNSTNAHQSFLQVAAPLGTTDVTYTIPATSAANTSDEVCLKFLGNCSGATNTVTGSGTQYTLAMFNTNGSVIADSIVHQDAAGTQLTINGSTLVNAPTGFTGNLLDLQVNGVSQLSVNQAGNLTTGGSISANGVNSGTGLIQGTGGLSITGTTSLNGATSVVGGNSFTVGTGAATFGGTLSVTSGATSLGGSLTVTGATTLSSTLNVGGTSTFTGLATFNGGVSVGNNSNFTQTGTGTFSTGTGNVSLNGATTVSSTANIQGLLTVGTATADGQIAFTNSTNGYLGLLQIAAPSGTSNVTYTIPSTSLGDTICLKDLGNCAGASNTVTATGGQANYVARFTSPTQLGIGKLFDDGTYVGVNTTTDAGQLSIVSRAAAETGLFVQGAASATTPVAVIKGGATPGVGGDLLQLQTAGGTVVAKFDANGNLTTTGSITAVGVNSGTGLIQGTGGLSITGTTSLNGATSVTGANSFTVGTGATSLGGSLSVAGLSTFNGNVSISTTNTLTTGTGAVTFGSLSPGGIVQADASGVLSAGAVDRNSATLLNGTLNVSNGGTGLNSVASNGILLGTGTNSLSVLAPVADRVLGTDATGIPSYLDTLPSVVQGNITSVSNTAGLSSGTITTGFGTISTTSDISTTANLQGGTLKAGSTQQFQVDASGNLTTSGNILGASFDANTAAILNIGATNATSIKLNKATEITGLLTLDSVAAANATNVALCLTTGNQVAYCPGSASTPVTTTSNGSDHTIAMFTGSNTIANSILTQSGTNDSLTVGGSLVVNTATGFTGNLLDLQVNGASKLSVNQAGNLTTGGSITSIGVNSGTGLIQGTGGLSITGTTSLNGAVSVTGANSFTTGTGAVTLGSLNTGGIVQADTNGTLSASAVDRNSATLLNGTLNVSNGGTGLTTVASNGILLGTGTNSLSVLSPVANSVLGTDGTGTPAYLSTLPIAVQDNITEVGALTKGSIGGAFGAISTGSNITTTANMQGANITATGALQGATLAVGSTQQFNVDASGNVTTSGSILGSSFDVKASGILNIGLTNATSIKLNQATEITGVTTLDTLATSEIGASPLCRTAAGAIAACVGGGGSVNSSGTQNFVAKFTDTSGNSIGNSSIYDNGTYVGINDPNKATDLGLLSILGLSTTQSGLFVQGTTSATAATPVTIIREGATSSADLIQFQNSTGSTVLAKIDASGNLTAAGGTFSGAVSVGGTLNVTGATTLGGATTVNSTTTLNGATSVTDGNNFTVGTGATTLGGGLSVTGATTLNGNVTQTGSTTFSTGTGAVSLNGATTAFAGLSVQGGAFKAGNSQQFQIDVSGNASTSGYVQAASFDAKTLGTQLTIGATNASSIKLVPATEVGGILTLDTLGTGDNSNVLCLNSTNQVATCSGGGYELTTGDDFIKNHATTQQAGSYFNIGAPASTVAAKIQGGSGADIIDFYTSADGTNAIAKIDQNGNFTAVAGTFNGLVTANGGVTVAANQNLALLNGNGTFTQSYTSAAGSSAQTLSVTNANTTAGATVNAETIALTGTANGTNFNTTNAINFSNVTAQTNNTYNGLYFGTGYSNILNYNGNGIISGGGKFQNFGFDVNQTYSNLQKVGALNIGSITTGFGTIATNSDISTTANLQGGTLKAGSTQQFQVDATGNVTTSGNILGASFDTNSAAILNIGLTNASSIKLNKATEITGLVTLDTLGTADNSATLCLNSLKQIATCQGGGGTVTTGTANQNFVAKFTNSGATQLGNSSLYDDGTYVGINNDNSGGTANKTGLLSIIGASTTQSGLFVQGTASGTKPVAVLREGTGSTADILQVQDSTGTTVLAKIDASGALTATGATINGNVSIANSGTLTVAGATTLTNLSGGGIVKAAAGTGLLSAGAVNLASNEVTGTLGIANGGTGATSFTDNGILFGKGNGPIQATAAAANSILATNGSNVPALTQTLPNAVQTNITQLGTVTTGAINSTAFTISTGTGNITSTGTLQGATVNATTGFKINNTAPAGHYLRGNGTSYVDSALLASDISGTLFTLAASAGTNQAISAGDTISILKGSSNNLTTTASTPGTITVDIISNPTFSGLVKSTADTQGLAATGQPTPGSGITSLLQLGANAITGGNSVANGGTYFGINAPATGAGSAADFINLQSNGVLRFKVDNSGLVTAGSGYAVNGNTGTSQNCGSGQGIVNGTFTGGILTGGSCGKVQDSLQDAYNNSSTNNPQILLSSTFGGLKIQDGATAVSGNLLQITNNGGSTTYFGVSSSQVTITDNLAVTGGYTQSGTGTNSFTGATTFTATGTAVNVSAGIFKVGASGQFQVDNTGAVTIATLGANNTVSYLCRNSTNQIANCATTGTGAAFVQGGNSFGAAGDLGTNDNFALNFRTGGTTKLQLDTTGNLFFQQNSNIDTANGATTLNIGKTNARSIILGNATSTTVDTFTAGAYGMQVANGGVNITSAASSGADLTLGDATNVQGRTIKVVQASTGAGANLTIQAGSAGTGAVSGGNLVLQAGAKGTTGGTVGTVIVKANGSDGTAFQVQKSDGTALISANTSTLTVNVGAGTSNLPSTTGTGDLYVTGSAGVSGLVLIGTSTNGGTFDATRHELVFTGTARHRRSVTLSPEYPGATMTGSGVGSNIGTMTSDFCSGSSHLNIPATNNPCGATDDHNYYSWTSTTAGGNYDIYVRYQLPSDFDAFSDVASAVQMYGWATNTGSNDSVNVSIYNGGNLCGTTTQVAGSGVWSFTNIGGYTYPDFTNCANLQAGTVLTFRIRMTAGAAGDYARAGEIQVNYLSKY